MGGFLPKSPHDSPDESISSQILATSATSGVTMRRNLPQPRNDSSSGSSVSDELGGVVHMAFMQECVKNFHLEQQLAQTLHMLDHVRDSLGVSLPASMPQIGNSSSMLPYMTNRAHLNNNDTYIMLDETMNGTSYHS
jgi:hypothetical protein